MSQGIFDSIDPAISGDDLATTLDAFKNAVVSGLSGTSRPTELQAGGFWVDTTNDPATWALKFYTGSADVIVMTINLTSNVATAGSANSEFDIQRVSADTVGSVLKLIKQRISSNGQVKDGDVVGEIRFIGRASDASNPVVAKMIWTATDDQTNSQFGGTLSFQSVPDASGTLTEHMRLIGGLVESVVTLKQNSSIIVAQSVATAASIAQLDATKLVVEFTGTTATNLQGINSGQATQLIHLHNRSSANVTLKNQDAGGAAADRLKLPTSADYVLIPDATASLYYCLTDTRWKLISTSDKSFTGFSVESFYGNVGVFTAKTTVARLRAYTKRKGFENNFSGLIDMWGNGYAWGANSSGSLGVGDVVSRSSPVAVVGGNVFIRMMEDISTASALGIRTDGTLYAWGTNTSGQLGVGDVIPRSSPVAVLGGLRWNKTFALGGSTLGISQAGVMYAWGLNTTGNLGVGDVTPRSSPVAVLSSQTFLKASMAFIASEASTVAITKTGALYAWGFNDKGQLGLGDIIPRSSPVAVLGGLTFSDVVVSGSSYLGLSTSGTLYAWGRNDNGQLGVGDVVSRSSPVAVLGGLTFKQISAHSLASSFLALTTGGQLYAWGSNSQGQLGVGDIVDRSSPVAVVGGLSISKAYVFQNFSLALDANGVAYAWGSNVGGVLGVGDVVSRSSPVAVLGGLTFDALFSPMPGQGAVIGIQGDGTLYSWGSNTSGQLGLGDVISRSSPVAVVGNIKADNTQPSLSADLTLVIGNQYTINIADGGMATFNGLPVGLNIGRIEIEYLQ